MSSDLLVKFRQLMDKKKTEGDKTSTNSVEDTNSVKDKTETPLSNNNELNHNSNYNNENISDNSTQSSHNTISDANKEIYTSNSDKPRTSTNHKARQSTFINKLKMFEKRNENAEAEIPKNKNDSLSPEKVNKQTILKNASPTFIKEENEKFEPHNETDIIKQEEI